MRAGRAPHPGSCLPFLKLNNVLYTMYLYTCKCDNKEFNETYKILILTLHFTGIRFYPLAKICMIMIKVLMH